MPKCLICYQNSASPYHPSCAKELFGQNTPPRLDLSATQVREIAKKAISRSLAVTGVQKKLSLSIEKMESKENRLTIVGVWGAFILKPPTEEYPEMPEVEALSMRMAEHFGIQTVPNGLIQMEDQKLAYLTRRIDRVKGRKIHMEDCCQLLGRLTEDKYKSSMEKVGKIIGQFSSARGLDLGRFFEIALYSFLIGNADMHLKNFSLIKYPKGWQLAPAYDLVATRLLISAKDDPEEMALPINGRKAKLKPKDFIAFGKNIGLRERQIQNFMGRMNKRLPSALPLIDQSFLSAEKKEQFRDLIVQRGERLQLP